jgi:hypothetical protein
LVRVLSRCASTVRSGDSRAAGEFPVGQAIGHEAGDLEFAPGQHRHQLLRIIDTGRRLRQHVRQGLLGGVARPVATAHWLSDAAKLARAW